MIFEYLSEQFRQIATLDSGLILFAVLVICLVIVVDAVTMYAREEKKKIGLLGKNPQIDGSTLNAQHQYESVRLGLAGKPDAVLEEGGFLIPVERKPLDNKIRDRYVAQLLVYMRLIEECEGKRPPYGYLILGANHRKVMIENSAERVAWLQSRLDQMRAIADGFPAKPDPHPKKCAHCSVNLHCSTFVSNSQVKSIT